jgi:hypothetical protein
MAPSALHLVLMDDRRHRGLRDEKSYRAGEKADENDNAGPALGYPCHNEKPPVHDMSGDYGSHISPYAVFVA